MPPQAESLQTPKPRIAKACSRCRAKKEKCDGTTPSCSRCNKHGTDCVYGELKRRGKGRRPSRFQFLERRLDSIESILAHSKTSNVHAPDASGSFLGEPLVVRNGPSPSPDLLNATNALVSGESHAPEAQLPIINTYTQAATLFSLSSSNGSNWQISPTCLYPRSTDEAVEQLNAGLCLELPAAGQVHTPLLPGSYYESLFKVFLDQVNQSLPIFDRMSLVDMYSNRFPIDSTVEEPTKSVCLDTAAAIALQRNVANDDFRASSKHAWQLFGNAFSASHNIITSDLNLLSIQTLLLMVLFLRGTADAKALSLLITTATRMVRMLGLDEEPDSKLNALEAEQRKRVFWITYMFDVESSITSGLPLNLDSGQLSLPSMVPPDGLGVIEVAPNVTVNVFRLAVELTLIEARAHSLLHPKVARPSPNNDAYDVIHRLDCWRQGLPVLVRPSWVEQAMSNTVDLSICMLHLRFYRCGHMIHYCLLKNASTGNAHCSVSNLDLVRLVESTGFWRDTSKYALDLIDHINTCYIDTWLVLTHLLPFAMTLVVDALESPAVQTSEQSIRFLTSFMKALDRFKLRGFDIERYISWCKLVTSLMQEGALKMGDPNTAMAGTDIPQPVSGAKDVTEQLSGPSLRNKANFIVLCAGLTGNLPGANALLRSACKILLSGVDMCPAALAPEVLRPETYRTGRNSPSTSV
ncbi:fungal-specific transcription factor domain-containing protein [Xylariales sp. PMI_506]|nr:fungal-specific transcription factor domain-containing protein [Xylariales sp. PMI_506]